MQDTPRPLGLIRPFILTGGRTSSTRPGLRWETLVETLADRARDAAGATVGLAVRAIESGEDTQVEVAVSGPFGARETRQTAFLGGTEGRRRAGIAAAAFLHATVRDAPAAE